MNRIGSIWCLLPVLVLAGCVAAGPQEDLHKYNEGGVHYKLGISHLQANNPSLALKELLIAEKNDPQSSAVHAALAQAYQLKKAYAEAERHYLLALKLSDNDPRYQNNLGALYLDMERWDDAIAHFEEAANNLLFLNPHVAISGEGYAYFKKDDLEAAEHCYQQAISMAPGFAQAHYLLSEVYHKQGREDRERYALERAVSIAPDYVQALYQLGVLSLKQQRLKDAKDRFKKVRELAPDTEWGQLADDMLRSMANHLQPGG
jgi:Tfp pilus assembly protein PilF